jgi:uncharacterized protein (TIGR02594 family)
MTVARLPRGAFARLGIVGAIGFALALALGCAGHAEAHGRPPQARGEDVEARAVARGSDVIAEASRWLGHANPTGMTGPWCAWFASFVLQRTGHRPLPNGLAISALRYGRRVAAPRPGDLAVMRGHVGFVEVIEPDGSVRIISGNWGRRVARGVVSRSQVVAFVSVS